MNYSYKTCVAFFAILISTSTALSMDKKYLDVESGSETSHSYQTIQGTLEPINPINRKRSAWTNFYTAAGGLIGTGITATVTWHLATSHTADEIDEASIWVYGSGTFVATFGVCCYFATYGADIFHSSCKKMVKKLKKINGDQGDI